MFRRHSTQRHVLLLLLLLLMMMMMMMMMSSGLYWAREGFHDAPLPPADDPSDGSAEASAEVVRGRVGYVFDGDTLALQAGGRTWRVRLVGIDAPEHSQPYGDEARGYLAARCEQRRVDVVVHGYDRYERILGDVYLDDIWINGELVARGHAWSWPGGEREGELRELQRAATRARLGLWADAQPVAPWEYRRHGRADGNRRPQTPASPMR